MLLTVIQVLIALVIVIVLFVIAFYIYNREYIQAIQSASKLRKRVDIFKGIKDLKHNKDEMYDTYDKSHPTFKDVQLSVNQRGGAEFSYNFWIYKSNSIQLPMDTTSVKTDQGLRTDDIVLFLKGLKKTYEYKSLCNTMKQDVLVKCPLVKLQSNMDILTVEINTVTSPDGVREQARDTCKDSSKDWRKVNSHIIAVEGLSKPNFDKKWFMVTIVLQDVSPLDPLPFRNRVRARIYVNGVMELDRYIEGSLGSVGEDASVVRQNIGPLYVAPAITVSKNNTPVKIEIPDNIPEKSLYLADLSYYNYSLPIEEINSLYKAGFTESIAPSVADTANTREAIYETKAALSFTDGKKQLREF